jgi:hypothetical protein
MWVWNFSNSLIIIVHWKRLTWVLFWLDIFCLRFIARLSHAGCWQLESVCLLVHTCCRRIQRCLHIEWFQTAQDGTQNWGYTHYCWIPGNSHCQEPTQNQRKFGLTVYWRGRTAPDFGMIKAVVQQRQKIKYPLEPLFSSYLLCLVWLQYKGQMI